MGNLIDAVARKLASGTILNDMVTAEVSAATLLYLKARIAHILKCLAVFGGLLKSLVILILSYAFEYKVCFRRTDRTRTHEYQSAIGICALKEKV